MENDTPARREPWRYMVLVVLFAAAAILVTVVGLLLGVSSPVFAKSAPAIAWTVAWMAWWPILRPRTGFFYHVASGVVVTALVLAITLTLTAG